MGFPASRRNRSLDRSDRFVDGQSNSNLFVEALTRSSTVFLADACPYRHVGAGLAGAPHTLLILSLVYLGSFLSYRSFKRLKSEARAEENDVDESETEVVNEEGGDEAPSTHLREV